jgi:hypothetical protein
MGNDEPAGVARNSCPHCGERVALGFFSVIAVRRRSRVTCKHCGNGCQFADGTIAASIFSGIIGFGLAIWLCYPNIDVGSIMLGGVMWCLASASAAAMTLRLEPIE